MEDKWSWKLLYIQLKYVVSEVKQLKLRLKGYWPCNCICSPFCLEQHDDEVSCLLLQCALTASITVFQLCLYKVTAVHSSWLETCRRLLSFWFTQQICPFETSVRPLSALSVCWGWASHTEQSGPPLTWCLDSGSFVRFTVSWTLCPWITCWGYSVLTFISQIGAF